jgi:hypothetical protein
MWFNIAGIRTITVAVSCVHSFTRRMDLERYGWELFALTSQDKPNANLQSLDM